MNENLFRSFLENEGITEKAIKSRISKCYKAESILNKDLDLVVKDDKLMYDSLLTLKAFENPEHAVLSNAVRKYYIAVNNKEFPKLEDYKKTI